MALDKNTRRWNTSCRALYYCRTAVCHDIGYGGYQCSLFAVTKSEAIVLGFMIASLFVRQINQLLSQLLQLALRHSGERCCKCPYPDTNGRPKAPAYTGHNRCSRISRYSRQHAPDGYGRYPRCSWREYSCIFKGACSNQSPRGRISKYTQCEPRYEPRCEPGSSVWRR